MSWFGKKKLKATLTKDHFIKFRISFPISNGYVETKDLDIVVPAVSKEEAKAKLIKFAERKIKVVVVEMSEEKLMAAKEKEKYYGDLNTVYKDLMKTFDDLTNSYKKR